MVAARRSLALVAATLSLALLGGCAEEPGQLREDVRARAERVRERAERVRERAERIRERGERIRQSGERVRERLAQHVRDVLEDIPKTVPEAAPDTRAPASRGRTEPTDVALFLTEVLRSVDAYWTRTLAASGLEEPRVSYVWVPPGGAVRTGCRVVADDQAAFYCTADDTIYVAERFAAELWQGISDDFPGQRAGRGRAVGDFGLAYVVAHEYAHNVQHELGFYSLAPRLGAKPFELQADCMAGLWGNSVYREGLLKPGDVEEAMSTALAAGDFDYFNANHHGTPEERRDAWVIGYSAGDPRHCREYVPA